MFAAVLLFAAALACPAQNKIVLPAQQRLVVIDQDASGPGGTGQMSILAMLQAPGVKVLGITIVTGDGWRDEEVRHTLRMLELTGHTEVPVAVGANGPLVRTLAETRAEEQLAGKTGWLGAWNEKPAATIPEGEPALKPIGEDAAHFLIRQVRAHPHQVTILAAGPLTNIALAIALDPEFASLTRGIALMGASIDPQAGGPETGGSEFAADPRHEFNLWFDPEAAHIVFHAAWPSIEVTTADVSLKAPFSQSLFDRIAKANTPAARYIASWSKPGSYMWDELAFLAWLDPAIITRRETLYLDTDLSHGPSYGDTLAWTAQTRPAIAGRPAHVQLDLDLARFQHLFIQLMTNR